MSINISSTSEWQTLLSDTNLVIADFYADWCGPCKVIAPHFEKLAKEHARPKKVAFAKINVDSQSTIARTNGVSAMPTFKIFHGGNCIETIKGANPPALTEAISKALKLGDTAGANRGGVVFKTPGRKLGGASDDAKRGAAGRAAGPGFQIPSLNISGLINFLVTFVGLYIVSLLSLDPYKSAEHSQFNIHRKPDVQRAGGGSSGQANGARPPARREAFKTLADLGEE